MNIEYLSPGFYELICDASYSLFLAQNASDDYGRNRLARSSILSSVLSIESFSNCLINTLILSKRTSKAFDRLTILSKIDVFLEFTDEKPLVRGSPEVQKISELIRLRNDFVHVKKTKLEGSYEGITSTDKRRFPETPEYDFNFKAESYSTLGIPRSALAWQASDAHSVLLAVVDFFSNVVSQLNQTNNLNVRNNLAIQLKVGDLETPFISEELSLEIQKLGSIGIDLRYLTDI